MQADELRARIAVWEKVVDVQMHFNELEMKIRNFAILLISAFLGGAGLALKDDIVVTASQVPLAGLLCFACAAVALLFLFVDLVWYHPLLKGAVTQGLKVEEALEKQIPYINLAKEIGAQSKYSMFQGKWTLTSTTKIKTFYFGLIGLFILTGTLLLLARPTTTSVTGSRAAHEPTPTSCISLEREKSAPIAYVRFNLDATAVPQNNPGASLRESEMKPDLEEHASE